MSADTPVPAVLPAISLSLPDPRVAVFCSTAVPDLFHAVAHQHEIWRPDPYDVEDIHADARNTFTRLLNRATTPPGLPAGRILLLLGESGSGKTHLLRAFRSQVHGRHLGYCGYLQMTTAASNFSRYVLGKLLESLDQPYLADEGDTSGLLRLSNAVVESAYAILPGELLRLREGHFDDTALAVFVHELADMVVQEDTFADLDIDLIRALLFLQRRDARLRNRVMRYLRCEDLGDRDRQMLGGIVPRSRDEHPAQVLALLGRTMARVQSAALVVCFDQFDDMNNSGDAQRQFRQAMTTICALADEVPSSLFVISCLEDFYEEWKKCLTRSLLDRMERDPEPVRLTSPRSAAEVEQLIARRLSILYDTADAPFREEEPTFPFPAVEVAKLTNLRTRDVLDWCRGFRERCVLAGRLVGQGIPAKPVEPPALLGELPQLWNDCQSAPHDVPDDETALAALLGWAIGISSGEMTTGHWFETEIDGRLLQIEIHLPDGGVQKLVAGVCNKSAQGGALAKQLREVEDRAGENVPVVVRSTEFPGGKSKVVEQLGQLVKRGGRRVVVPDADWRTIRAFQEFHAQHKDDLRFADWVRQDRPLTQLKSLRDVLDLDHLPDPVPVPVAPSLPEPVTAPPATSSEPLLLGSSLGIQPAPVTLLPRDLMRHSAFLGGSGSGKTTLALNVIEQLLLRGVPALLLDRKGDLCGYARPEVWTAPLEDSNRAKRRAQLQSRIDVAVYTPGNAEGRALSIPLAPNKREQMPTADREEVAQYSAAALAGMMGYKDQKKSDGARIAILSKALNLASTVVSAAELTLDHVLQLLDGPDPLLLNAIGRLEPKNCKQLVQDLETLRLNKKHLLASEGERLHVETLLGLGSAGKPGKTRLCIISTKFLGDNASIEFWVAQLLLEVARYANRHPANELQAVLLFDEADMYLPSQRKPATKEPMENLLKRARSAGLGVMLASQSPGDFDYKCRDNVQTWLLGKITQPPSIAKMKPLLSDCRIDITGKLPQQQTGQFYLVREGEPVGFQAQRSFLATEQLADDEILKLAQANRPKPPG